MIAHQTTHGVAVVGASTGNVISRNSIFSNGALGIDLDADGVTPNDLPAGNEDVDTGPNELQNTPVLVTATLNGTDLDVNYGVPSAAAHAVYPLTVELFIADAAGQEGEVFLAGTDLRAAAANHDPHRRDRCHWAGRVGNDASRRHRDG